MKDKSATVTVNINKTEEEILNSLDKRARYGISRAKRDGLVVEETNKEEDWNDFYKIYEQTVIEGGASADTLEELKKSSAVLLVCKKEGKVIAGAALKLKVTEEVDYDAGGSYIIRNEKPILYVNASLKEYQNSQPNNLLYWECILWSKKRGCKVLDLGGWQINASGHLIGINKFKEKWGQVEYSYENYPISKAIGRKLIRNSKFFWWLNKIIKGRKC